METILSGPTDEFSYDELDFEQANDLVKGRQRYFRRPKQSAELLSRLMARKGYAQNETKSELETVWNEIVGPKWQDKTKPGIIRGGVLEIMVVSSAVNQHLGFQKKKLLTELQTRLPKNNFKDLRFKVGKIR
jgi:predicted nucleic acid-binding Zn ribbon protein